MKEGNRQNGWGTVVANKSVDVTTKSGEAGVLVK